jgi:hypothetical protein
LLIQSPTACTLASDADDATPRAAKEQAIIIEGRTIKNIAEMLEFCLAAIAQTGVEPSAIRLHVAQDMRVAEIRLKDGSTAYDVLTSPAA